MIERVEDEGPLEPQDAEVWIRLASVDLGARRLRHLVEWAGDADAALQLSRPQLRAAGLVDALADRFVAAASAPLKTVMARMKSLDIRVLPYTSTHYPASLHTLFDPPVALFMRGSLAPSDAFAIAMVGSRRATEYGKSTAERIASDLAELGVTVVSGLARGVDTAAHLGALSGGGRTLAVLGCGVDIAYPSTNRSLMERIAREGAVLSEFAPGTQPDAWRFPARNRIISGLARGVVVVESPESSGTLITVNFALEQGKDVFAVPGSIQSGLNAGCHRLIREGAVLVESASQVMEAFGMAGLRREKEPPAAVLSPVETQVHEGIDFTPIHPDALVNDTGLSPAEVNAALLMLELYGRVRKLPGGTYVRASLI